MRMNIEQKTGTKSEIFLRYLNPPHLARGYTEMKNGSLCIAIKIKQIVHSGRVKYRKGHVPRV